MSRIQAANILRQCTASLSPSVAATRRAALRRSAMARPWMRSYATQEQTTQAEAEKSEEKAGSSSSEPKNELSAEQKELEQCREKLKAKEQEAVDLTGRLRYLQADFLNLQRNAAREKEQTKDFAITRFAGDLLETVDVLSLALKSVPESVLKPPTKESSESSNSSDSPSSSTPSESSSSSSVEPTKSAQDYLAELHHGVEMTHRLLLSTLFKYNVKPFDPTGDKFDPNRHEALYQAPIPGKEAGTVIECQKTGYTIKDRTLRAAQVGVVAETPKSS